VNNFLKKGHVLRIIIIIIVIIIIESGRWLGKKKARARAATASPATVCVVHYPKMQPITTPGTPAATLIIRVQKRKVKER